MEDFIEWLEDNPDLIIAKTIKNISTFEELEAEVVIDNKILCPSSSLELAEIFEEYLNLLAVLESVEVELPSDIKEELKVLSNKCLTKLLSIASVEANNGNLALFINIVVDKESVPNIQDLVNFNGNMININFKNYEEGVVYNI